MPVRKCNSCFKEYSCRQSLFVHKKKCKGRHQHPSLERKVPYSLKEFISMVDDIKNGRSDGEDAGKIIKEVNQEDEDVVR